MANPHKVAIVVEPDFESKLEALSQRMHVWICASPSNKEAAQRIRSSGEGYDLDSGITTFEVLPAETPPEMVIRILPTVDDHHSEYSHDPPWSIIEVHGAPLTPQLEAAFREFEVTEFDTWSGGFTCRCASSGAA